MSELVDPAPSGPAVLVVGEALVDVVVPPSGEVRRHPGGSPMNVAVGLARLGVPTLLMTQLGDDADGRLVADHLAGSGVALDAASVDPATRTSTATARLDPSGAATYEFALSWDLAPRRLPGPLRALHVGSLGTALRPGRDQVLALVAEATAAGAVVSFDPNARPALAPDPAQARADADEAAAAASVVKLSDEDLAFLYPDATAAEVAARLLDETARLVVVTAGGRGATAFSAEATVELPSPAVQVADTVGAGDSFMAALLVLALEQGLERLDEPRLTAYLRAAHAVAAVTVARHGADPPRRDELPVEWPWVERSTL